MIIVSDMFKTLSILVYFSELGLFS